MSYRLCISDVVHMSVKRKRNTARSVSLHVRSGIHTTTQRDTVPSCIYMVHCRKRIAWLLVEAKRSGS